MAVRLYESGRGFWVGDINLYAYTGGDPQLLNGSLAKIPSSLAAGIWISMPTSAISLQTFVIPRERRLGWRGCVRKIIVRPHLVVGPR